jgi:hypothetical protein
MMVVLVAILGLVVSLLINEVGDVAPWLARQLLCWGARQLGSSDRAARYTEEWLANLEHIPGKLTKLGHAVGVVVLGVPRLRRHYARQSRAASVALPGTNSGLKLRTHLASIYALLAILCLTIGVVTELALRNVLMEQLDNQLDTTSQRLGDRPPGGGGPPNGGGGPRPPPPDGGEGGSNSRELLQGAGNTVGTLSARVIHGVIEFADYLDASAEPQALSAEHYELLLSMSMRPDNRPRTEMISGLGEYRMVAAIDHAGNIQITGLPLSTVNRTLLQTGWVIAAIGLLGLVLTGAIGALIVRFTLRR